MIELQNIFEYNGQRIDSAYNNRKSKFDSINELDKYRQYLEKKLGKAVFFQFKDWSDKGGAA